MGSVRELAEEEKEDTRSERVERGLMDRQQV